MKTSTVSLLLAVCVLAVPFRSARAEDTNSTPDQPQCVLCVVALCGVVVVVGGYLSYKLWRFCHEHLPQPPAPPNPPPAPPPPAPPRTNAPPRKAFVMQTLPRTNDWAYDVTSYGWTDPDGLPYLCWFGAHMPLEVSADLTTWTSNALTLEAWMSSSNVLAVASWNGVPIATNLTRLAVDGGNIFNLPDLTAPLAGAPRQFYRCR